MMETVNARFVQNKKNYKKDASDKAEIISPGFSSSMTNFRDRSVHFI